MSAENTKDYKKLELEFDLFFEQIDKTNFYLKYDQFINLVMGYKDIFNREQILTCFYVYGKSSNLTEPQEEVLLEIANRISGYCSPISMIHWDN